MNDPVKVLALLASPRKGGNTEILLNRVKDGLIDEGSEVETVNLAEMPVAPIKDCDICLEQGECTITGDDNYHSILEKFISSECVLFATPTYWYSISAQMKSFIDRWSCSLKMKPDFRDTVRGKKVAVITVHGENDPTVTKHLFGQMMMSFQYLGLDFIGKIQGKAYEKGTINGNKKTLDQAYRFGVNIAKRRYFSVK